jgi:hypothetical protein
MKKALLIFLIFAGTVYANEKFSTKSNFVRSSEIVWIHVDNVFDACDSESKKRGNGGFPAVDIGNKMDACAFWSDPSANRTNVCTIITGKNTDQDTVGHEVRHCFQGNFHK